MRPVSVGILSIGDMGLGVARLLKAHDYRVLTVGLGRRYSFYCLRGLFFLSISPVLTIC